MPDTETNTETDELIERMMQGTRASWRWNMEPTGTVEIPLVDFVRLVDRHCYKGVDMEDLHEEYERWYYCGKDRMFDHNSGKSICEFMVEHLGIRSMRLENEHDGYDVVVRHAPSIDPL